jgi:HTH-type transcriptional regulator / antitoxin HigA
MLSSSVRPIRTESDYGEALEDIQQLWSSAPGTPEADRLEVLAILVSDYEAKHFPIPPPDPVDALLFFMEMHGLTRRDIERQMGGRSRVSEVLNRKRGLSKEMIRGLHARFGIPTDVLLGVYSPERAAA